MFFKISQNSQETPVPKETPVNFAKFSRTFFLQSNSGRLLLKEIDCLCCREVDAMHIALAKMVEHWGGEGGEHLAIQLLWASADY